MAVMSDLLMSVCVCGIGQLRRCVVSYLVLLEESGNPGGELADCSLLLSHHVVQVQLHLTHWGGGRVTVTMATHFHLKCM